MTTAVDQPAHAVPNAFALMQNYPDLFNPVTVTFDGSKLASGVYLYRLTAGVFSDTKRLVLIR